jgi:hypothetical protein
VDAPGKDGNASMPEQVKRPNPWRKIIIIIIIIIATIVNKQTIELLFLFSWQSTDKRLLNHRGWPKPK